MADIAGDEEVCGDGLRTLLTPAAAAPAVADDDSNGSLQSLLLARRARDSTPALVQGTLTWCSTQQGAWVVIVLGLTWPHL